MISSRVLSCVAALALVLPMAAPGAGLAQPVSIGKAAGRSGPVGGGVHIGGGAPPTARFGGGGPAYIGRGGGGGGGWQGGTAGVYHRRGGFIPGAVAGAVIGGAIAAAPYGYYGGGPGYGYYDAPGYYDDQYYDNGPVVVAPAQGSVDTVDYCMQTYRSYDPQSGTYLGLDGLRHLCP